MLETNRYMKRLETTYLRYIPETTNDIGIMLIKIADKTCRGKNFPLQAQETGYLLFHTTERGRILN